VALFAYRAVDEEGRVSSGSLDASNPIDLELRLRRLGLDLVTFEGVKKSAAARSRSVTRQELITFCFHLSQLLKAGVNIIEALTDLRDTVDNPGLRQVVAGIIEDIEGGLKLSEAMASHPYIFDAVFVALVRAGEQSGQLNEVLDELSENIKWQDEIAGQAQRALVYPAIVFTVIAGVIFVLLTVLVPQLAVTFKTLVPKLPRETELLIGLSNIFVKYWYLIIGGPIAAGIGLFLAVRSNDHLQAQMDAVSIRLPVIGPIRFKIMLARFSTFFAMLYRSGISVLDCIQICEKIMGNRLMEQALQHVGRSISEGQGISQAFTSTKLFPPLVLRMLRVGESTGGLDVALLNVSYFYNREVREGITKMQALIGPATTIVLGGLIVAILYTIFLPLYDVISRIKF
jgi:type IV pilus assembly protein PilC